MPLPLPMPPAGGEEPQSDAPQAGEDEYAKAFRVLRHAMADGDDAAGGQALRDAVKACMNAEEDEGPESEEGSKPNLGALLIAKAKKKKDY